MKPSKPAIPKTELVITPQTFFKTIGLVIGTVLALAALQKMSNALLLVGMAFFLALALNAPVSFVARHIPGKAKGSRAMATSIAFLVVILFLGGFIASMVPPLVRQTESFLNAVPGLVQDVRDQRGPVGELVRTYNLQDQVDELSDELEERVKNGAGAAFSTLQSFGSSVVSVLTVLVMTFMMLVEGPRWVTLFKQLIPSRRKKTVENMMGDMYRVVKGYVNGQVTLAALAALVVSPILFIMDVRYAAAMVVVVFVCGLIPMIGATLGAIIVGLVALFTSVTSAIVVLMYYIIYQQIENYLVQPRIQANSTDMSPLLVFVSVVIGMSFGGLLGGLVAIPVAGCIRVVLLEYIRSTRSLTNAPAVKEEIASATGRDK